MLLPRYWSFDIQWILATIVYDQLILLIFLLRTHPIDFELHEIAAYYLSTHILSLRNNFLLLCRLNFLLLFFPFLFINNISPNRFLSILEVKTELDRLNFKERLLDSWTHMLKAIDFPLLFNIICWWIFL